MSASLGFVSLSLFPISWFAMKVHYCNNKYSVVFFRIQDPVWKSLYQRPPDVAFEDSPSLWEIG